MEKLLKLYLAGAFGIDSVLRYNSERLYPHTAFEGYFPFWKKLPDAEILAADASCPDPEGVLIVINLNQKTWDSIQPVFSQYKKRILIQFEAKIGWELAYEKAGLFDYFISFDRTQSAHPGFRHMFIPYDPVLASSGRDKRGMNAVINQWRSSRKLFIDTYLLRILPKKKKSVLIATLNPRANYQFRKEIADRWPSSIDVFGGGWPKTMPNYRGFVSSKIDILKRYRFCLVMENQPQNGYITEKLLDCLPSGAVPIYWGAPDIHDYPGLEWVPTIADVECDLDRIVKDADLYRSARKQLLQNRNEILKSFSVDRFITTLCDVVTGGEK
jgi:hypothetical protein